MLYLTMIGFEDHLIKEELEKKYRVTKKGEIWNPRLNKRYQDNSLRIEKKIVYSVGLDVTLVETIDELQGDKNLMTILRGSRESEVQIRIDISDEYVPYLGLTNKTIKRIAEFGFDLDFTIR